MKILRFHQIYFPFGIGHRIRESLLLNSELLTTSRTSHSVSPPCKPPSLSPPLASLQIPQTFFSPPPHAPKCMHLSSSLTPCTPVPVSCTHHPFPSVVLHTYITFLSQNPRFRSVPRDARYVRTYTILAYVRQESMAGGVSARRGA